MGLNGLDLRLRPGDLKPFADHHAGIMLSGAAPEARGEPQRLGCIGFKPRAAGSTVLAA